MGVQRDTQDLGFLFADSHLRVESRLVDDRREQCHAGFHGSNGQLLSICPPHHKGAELVCPRICLHDAGSKGWHREVFGEGPHVNVRDGAVWHKDGDDVSLFDPRPHLVRQASGAVGRGTRPSCREGMAQAISPDCVGVGSGGSSRWGGSVKLYQTPSKCPPLWLLFC